MKKTTRAWLLVAAALVLLGGILFAGVMSALGWDFTRLSTDQYETRAYELREEFDSISIDTGPAGIVLAPAEDGVCTVVCQQKKTERHSVRVEDGTLRVTLLEDWTLRGLIGLSFRTPGITIYLPDREYASLFIREETGNIEVPEDFTFAEAELSTSTGSVTVRASCSGPLTVKTDTGDICAEQLSAGALALTVTTGRVSVSDVRCAGDVTVNVSTGMAELTDVACGSVLSNGSTGALSLTRVVADEQLQLKRSTGDIRLAHADAAEIYVETETGNVTGTLLTDKVFLTQSDTGHIDVPKTTGGGRCEIITGTGDIELTIG